MAADDGGWKRLHPPLSIHLPDGAGAGLAWTPGSPPAHTQETSGPRGCFLECSLLAGQVRARPKRLLRIPGAAACANSEMGKWEVLGCDQERRLTQPGQGVWDPSCLPPQIRSPGSPPASSLRVGIQVPNCLLLQTQTSSLPCPSNPQAATSPRPGALVPSALLPQTLKIWSQAPPNPGVRCRLPVSSPWRFGFGVPTPDPRWGTSLHIWDTSLLPQFPQPSPAPVGPAPVPPYPGAGRPGRRNPRGGGAELLPGAPSSAPLAASGAAAAPPPARWLQDARRPPAARRSRSGGPGSGAGAGRRPTAEEGRGARLAHAESAETSEARPGSLSPARRSARSPVLVL